MHQTGRNRPAWLVLVARRSNTQFGYCALARPADRYGPAYRCVFAAAIGPGETVSFGSSDIQTFTFRYDWRMMNL
jgi:hypothetical protein